jgi:hypothetical protein
MTRRQRAIRRFHQRRKQEVADYLALCSMIDDGSPRVLRELESSDDDSWSSVTHRVGGEWLATPDQRFFELHDEEQLMAEAG